MPLVSTASTEIDIEITFKTNSQKSEIPREKIIMHIIASTEDICYFTIYESVMNLRKEPTNQVIRQDAADTHQDEPDWSVRHWLSVEKGNHHSIH